AFAFTFSGVVSSNSISSSFGEVNGWCAATKRSSSSSYSNNGQSVIHTKLYLSSSINSNSLPSLFLKLPKLAFTTDVLSAPKNTRSFSFAPRISFSSFCLSSLKNFAIGPVNTPSLYFNHARPLAPYNFTYSSSASMSLREYLSALSFTTIALTIPPLSTVDLNTLKSTSLLNSLSSTSSIPKRVSGLSTPYLSIASS